METAIVKINPLEYGLTVETAANIESQFAPMLAKMTDLEIQFNAVVALNKELPEAAKKARELRLQYKDVRVGTEKIHKVQKAYYLSGGRFVDSWKNLQALASQNNEEILESIEKHAENLERERLEKLQESRAALLQPYLGEYDSVNGLSTMQEDVFQAYLSAKKQAFEDRKAAELKAENDRTAREKAEAEERELQRLENIRLKEEAEKREAAIEAERIERDRIEAEKEAEREKERKAEAAKLEKERIERDRIEGELKAKKDAEMKAESDRVAAENAAKLAAEKLANSSIKLQLTAWILEFKIPQTVIEHEKKTLIEAKFNRFLEWSKAEVETI